MATPGLPTVAPYRLVGEPPAETYQNNRWNTNGKYGGRDVGPRRNAPAELPYRLQKRGRWYEGPREVKGFKAPMFFVRPRDGKRPGARGRLMDALSGEGPDVFVIKCGDRRTFLRDCPQRWQWSGWELTPEQKDDRILFDKDFRRKDLRNAKDFSRSIEQTRSHKRHYNFSTRKYESATKIASMPPEFTWTNAVWAADAGRNDAYPFSFRDRNREWWTRIPPGAGDYAGGRPRRLPLSPPQ